MRKLIGHTTLSLAALGLLAASAFAQPPRIEVPELESDRLVDEGLVEAEILAADYDARTLTLRLEATDETAKVIVPEGADIFVTGDNNVEREVELTTLRPGDKINLQAVVIEGVVQLRIVTIS